MASRRARHILTTFRRAPWLLIVTMAVLVLPVLAALATAFVHDGRVSLHHVVDVYRDAQRLAQLAGNTAAVTGLTVALSLLLGVPLGWLLFRTDLPGRAVAAALLLALCCLPGYVVVTCWVNLLNLHLWSAKILAAGWVLGLTYTPLVTLIAGVTFRTLDPTLEQLALLDSRPVGVFWKVTLPQGAWGLLAAALAVAVLTMSDISVTDILLVRTFTEEVFAEFQLHRVPGPAAAVALAPVVVATTLGALFMHVARGLGAAATQTSEAPAYCFRLGWGRWPAAAFVLAVLALLLTPLGPLIRQVNDWNHFVKTLDYVKEELGYTLLLGGLAALLTGLLAWGPAWALARARRGRILILAWLVVLMTIPAPLVGVGITRLMNRPGLLGAIYDTPFIVIAAYVVRFLPYHVLAMLPFMRALPRNLEEEATLSGATRRQVLLRIVAPLCGRAALVGAALVFILAIGEVGASVLIVPPGRTTLTIHFFTLIHYGVYADAAAICILLTLMVVIPSLAFVLGLGVLGRLLARPGRS